MTIANGQQRGMGPLGWIMLVLALMVAGAALSVWGLAHDQAAAKFFGVASETAPVPAVALTPPPVAPAAPEPASKWADPADATRLSDLEQRLAKVENATQRAEGSAGRADALLVAFAARRAVDRGVPLGYLEALLIERFNAQHAGAVATVITAARDPVRLDQLDAEFAALAPQMQSGAPDEGVWQNVRRQFGSLVSIRRADQPSTRPNATYDRARARIEQGQVDQALAEAMRLPGIGQAGPWVAQARRYVAAHRALDEIESSALLARSQ